MTAADPAPKRQSRFVLWLILAVCVAPFPAAWIAYHFFPPQGRINYGTLIGPQVIPDIAMARDDGGEFRLSELRGRWIMIHADSGVCGIACRAKLYKMRQVRRAQGKDMDRVERIWLLTDAAPVPPDLRLTYDGTVLLRAQASAVLGALPAQNVRDHIFLVDPLGNLILRYPPDADPSRIKKDIQRLLRVSRVG